MIQAFISAAIQLGDPPISRVVRRVALWTAVIYVLLGVALWAAISGIDPIFELPFIPFAWLRDLMVSTVGLVVGVLGVFVFFALFWLLFVVVVQLVTGFYLEDIIAAVEARHFPDLPPVVRISTGAALINMMQYFTILLLLNLLALPFYLIPLIGLVVFYLVNSYLIGREYFDIVALRRIDAPSAKILRKANRGQIFGAGVITTFLLSLPILNLVAPIMATAAMVHIFENLPARQTAIEQHPTNEDKDE